MDGKRYVGCTGNLGERLKKHRNGRVKSTRSRRQLKLEYTESFESKIEAFKRESYFKTAAGRRYLDSVC